MEEKREVWGGSKSQCYLFPLKHKLTCTRPHVLIVGNTMRRHKKNSRNGKTLNMHTHFPSIFYAYYNIYISWIVLHNAVSCAPSPHITAWLPSSLAMVFGSRCFSWCLTTHRRDRLCFTQPVNSRTVAWFLILQNLRQPWAEEPWHPFRMMAWQRLQARSWVKVTHLHRCPWHIDKVFSGKVVTLSFLPWAGEKQPTHPATANNNFLCAELYVCKCWSSAAEKKTSLLAVLICSSSISEAECVRACMCVCFILLAFSIFFLSDCFYF